VNSPVIISVDVTGLNDLGSENEDSTISPPTVPAAGTKAPALPWIAAQSTGSSAPEGGFGVPQVDKRNKTGTHRTHVTASFMNSPFIFRKQDTGCQEQKNI
jgi:hypothetical protein